MNPQKVRMRPIDLVLFLFGNRGAIERVAATRMAWVIGACLVLTAGVARNYDHLDLLRQPEWFIGPFAASMVSILFIFLWITGPLQLGKVGNLWPQFVTFLTLAWLTAPCAWLYAIPVENMTDILTATKWNIAFLAIVAFWRVAIIVRAVSVLTDVRWIRALPLVLAPAALEALLGSMFKGLSLVGVMGGIRLPPHTQLLVAAANVTTIVSFWLLIGLFFFTFMVKGVAKMPLSRPTTAPAPSLPAVTAMLMLAWAAVAIPLHPKIANRHQLQSLIDDDNFQGAVAFASARSREDFPPHHYVPPEPSTGFPFKLLDEIPDDAPAWLRKEWLNSATESFEMHFPYQPEEVRRILARYPEISQAVNRRADELRKKSEERSRDEDYWLRGYDRAFEVDESSDEENTAPEP